jgi:protein-L-isoaspartate(D-aspartate) O-methyltransferase
MMKDAHREERIRLMREIAGGLVETRNFLEKSHLDASTHDAMMKVPRHKFVPRHLRESAYENRPLPIGQDQTISQPYIVAIMTDMLNLTPESRVLEVGTGCGYQAAVLAEIAATVFTIERVGVLADAAKERLARLGYGNIAVLHADGGAGWPAEAPFDAIVVTAAAEKIPEALLAQLRPGGRMTIPLGGSGWSQSLVLLEKDADGVVTEGCHLPVAFVPLVENIR